MLRMMKEGGFGEAFAAFDSIFKRNTKLLTTSVFVGLTTWLMLSSFFHIAERDNPDMIWIVSDMTHTSAAGRILRTITLVG